MELISIVFALKIDDKGSIKVKFSEYVQPICLLPDCYSLPSGTTAIVGGWGKNEGDELSQVFNFTTANVIENNECNIIAKSGQPGPDYLRRDGSQMCIGYRADGNDHPEVGEYIKNERLTII